MIGFINKHNKAIVALLGALAVGIGLTGDNAWLLAMWPDMPSWFPALIVGLSAAFGAELVPNGHAFWKILTPSVGVPEAGVLPLERGQNAAGD